MGDESIPEEKVDVKYEVPVPPGFKKVESKLWIPGKVGDVLEGRVVRVEPDGPLGFCIDVQKQTGEVMTTPAHTVLQDRLKSIKMGQGVFIAFAGEKPSKDPRHSPTRLYDVWTD